jgi:hypothetical protein
MEVGTIKIEHVRGQQDEANNGMITTEEALNIEADELTHITRKLPHIKQYDQSPANKVNFKLNHKYVNLHYPKMVNLGFHSMALREYFMNKYQW